MLSAKIVNCELEFQITQLGEDLVRITRVGERKASSIKIEKTVGMEVTHSHHRNSLKKNASVEIKVNYPVGWAPAPFLLLSWREGIHTKLTIMEVWEQES